MRGPGDAKGNAAVHGPDAAAGSATPYWPSTLPTPHLDHLLKSSQRQGDATAKTGSLRDGTSRSSLGMTSTERLDRALGIAFEKLWREQPPTLALEEENGGENAEVLSRIDGYLSNYFRRVAELNRECVYQGHQKRILQRMREDVIRGDRCGNVRDLDEKIQKADGDETLVQGEIAQMMRILGLEGGTAASASGVRQAKGASAGTGSSWVSRCSCCAVALKPAAGPGSSSSSLSEATSAAPPGGKSEEGMPLGKCGGLSAGPCVVQ